MTGSRTVSNVYYLPVVATAVLPPTEPMIKTRRWGTMIADVLWRVRFILAEIRHIARVPVPVMAGREAAILVHSAEFVTPTPRPRTTPARIIDFAAARLRLRPL